MVMFGLCFDNDIVLYAYINTLGMFSNYTEIVFIFNFSIPNIFFRCVCVYIYFMCKHSFLLRLFDYTLTL